MTDDVVRESGYLTLGTRLKRLGERLQAHTQRVLEAHTISVPAAQLPFLAALDARGPLTVGQLAEAVGVTQPATTKTLAQLEKSGLVSIGVADDDQRRRSIGLTKTGRRLVARCKRTVWPLIEAAVEELCGDEPRPLLDQLAAIEEGLEREPLELRAKALRAIRS